MSQQKFLCNSLCRLSLDRPIVWQLHKIKTYTLFSLGDETLHEQADAARAPQDLQLSANPIWTVLSNLVKLLQVDYILENFDSI